jgi:hypothetical protein
MSLPIYRFDVPKDVWIIFTASLSVFSKFRELLHSVGRQIQSIWVVSGYLPAKTVQVPICPTLPDTGTYLGLSTGTQILLAGSHVIYTNTNKNTRCQVI